jgi:hypothetical protein
MKNALARRPPPEADPREVPLSSERIPQNARASGRDARASTNREGIAEIVEGELERLRRLRPSLQARIDRAGGILLLQLASPPRTRPVRVRVRGGARPWG